MTCLQITKEQYKHFVEQPFCGFDSVEFAELNAHKVDEVRYFIFGEAANHFALVAGVKDGILKCPFSATFGIFSEIRQNNQINYYYEAIEALIAWCRRAGLKSIVFATPPLFYHQAHITKFQNALFCSGFGVRGYDVNFEFCLENAGEYEILINRNSKRKLKIAHKNNLAFEKTQNLGKVYEIIKANRAQRGFPLWMSQDEIERTASFVPSDYFLVSKGGEFIAAAYIQHIKEGVANVVYWGNLAEANELCPMNFLAEQVYKHYQNEGGVKYISIGTSTLDSVANVGLCYFKESVGCACSPKLTFGLDLESSAISLNSTATAICGGGGGANLAADSSQTLNNPNFAAQNFPPQIVAKAHCLMAA